MDPRTPVELRPQFEALCRALGLDPRAPDILTTLRDPIKVPWLKITQLIETDALGAEYGTFRGCLSSDWLPVSPGPMAWQQSEAFARGLRMSGVRSVLVGDLTEEWYLYSIAHPISSSRDIVPNLKRYFQDEFVSKLVKKYQPLPENASSEEAQRRFGDILSLAQVHLPVRILARDLHAANFPVCRYEIRWTPEQNRTGGECRSIWLAYHHISAPRRLCHTRD